MSTNDDAQPNTELLTDRSSPAQFISNGKSNQSKESFAQKSAIIRFVNYLLHFLQNNKLVVAIVTGAVLGTVIGISINGAIQGMKQPDRYTAVLIIGFPGELLLRGLKMLILPLITCSLIVGLSSLDGTVSGKVGARAVTYYFVTTIMAAILGIMLVSAIKPGEGMESMSGTVKEQAPVRPLDSFMDIVRYVDLMIFIYNLISRHFPLLEGG